MTFKSLTLHLSIGDAYQRRKSFPKWHEPQPGYFKRQTVEVSIVIVKCRRKNNCKPLLWSPHAFKFSGCQVNLSSENI
jgi:hypothetical protein